MSVLHNFSIVRTDAQPYSINANSVTFSKISELYLLRPVLLSLAARYFLRSILSITSQNYTPDHLFLLSLKFLLVILIETWYNLLVVYFVFAIQIYHKKTAFLSFSDKFAVFFIGPVSLQPLSLCKYLCYNNKYFATFFKIVTLYK